MMALPRGSVRIALTCAGLAALLLAIPHLLPVADAHQDPHEPAVIPEAIPEKTRSPAAAVDDLAAMIPTIPTPPGFSIVGSDVITLDRDDAGVLVVAEAKFHAPDRSALTVLVISGGNWDLEAELLAGGASRRSSAVQIGQQTGVVVDSEFLTSISWPTPGDLIIQVVQRGNLLDSIELTAFASEIAGRSE
ncbi:MAG: hypothetical protein R2823_02640 [Acidimicrobiia bacterium]